LPDAACAAGVGENGVMVGGTVTGMIVIGCYIPLVDYDPYDSVRAGLTALPNAAADASGGLPISDAGELDLDAKLANTNEVTAARMGALTDWIDGGRLDLIIDLILADTDMLQADWVNGGRLDLIIDAILADTNELQTDDTPAAIAALNDLSAANVNAEVVDVLETDTHAEPGQGVPPATTSLKNKIGYLYKVWRNKRTGTNAQKSFYDDAGAVIDHKRTISDGGATYSETEILSGP